MTKSEEKRAETLIDSLVSTFTSLVMAPDGMTPPATILWTDVDGQWLSVIPALKKAIPHLYSLGAYQAKERSGPSIWLRCVVERAVPEAPSRDAVPILYLPRVGRQDLRAGGDCPRELQPLIELQYRGAVWHQRNGRDWTVEAFLASESGCALDIAPNARTLEAMHRALPLLAGEPLAALRGKRLEADDFDRLAVDDPVRDLLLWMSDPKGFEARCEPARWRSFCEVCRREFSCDPDRDGVQKAADAVLNGGGPNAAKWDGVWRRFTEAPTLYSGVSRRMRDARPQGLFVDRARQPGENQAAEDKLRRDLEGVMSMSHGPACDKVLALEAEHGQRRTWVWARLGESPLALGLAPLARLAEEARNPLGGATARALADEYATGGWRCDRAVIEALTSPATAGDAALVARVVRALYEPWLDRSARRFQELMSAAGAGNVAGGVPGERDCCVLFTDGLRFDVGALLHERLETRGLRSRLTSRIAPLPTVTATAKPMASPAHTDIAGNRGTEDFTPALKSDGKPATAQRLRDAMSRNGVEVLEGDDIRFAGVADSGGWSEIGRLDELGHSMGIRVVSQVEVEVEAIADRVSSLLNAGWQRVRVVTDHGWLLLPGGLPKVEVPNYLVASRWARCATVRGESSTQLPVYPWHWNQEVRIASPPGAGSFIANAEYAHGGVSPQECVVPELIVERGEITVAPKIASAVWRGMRCKVAVAPSVAGLRADLRLNWKQADTTIAVAAKEVAAGIGEVSLACADDRHEGAAAAVVLLDNNGHVLDYRPTTVGEE